MKRLLSCMLCIVLCIGMVWLPGEAVNAAGEGVLKEYKFDYVDGAGGKTVQEQLDAELQDDDNPNETAASKLSSITILDGKLKITGGSGSGDNWANPKGYNATGDAQAVFETEFFYGDQMLEFEGYAQKNTTTGYTGKWLNCDNAIGMKVRTVGGVGTYSFRIRRLANTADTKPYPGALQAIIFYPVGALRSYTDETKATTVEETIYTFSAAEEAALFKDSFVASDGKEYAKVKITGYIRGEVGNIYMAMHVNDDPVPVLTWYDGNPDVVGDFRNNEGHISAMQQRASVILYDNIKVTKLGVLDETANYDKYNPGDIEVPISISTFDKKINAEYEPKSVSDMFRAVTVGNRSLIKGTDYTISTDGKKLILKQEFLNKLGGGAQTLTFEFNETEVSGSTSWQSVRGNVSYDNDTLTINVTGAPSISPATAKFEKYKNSEDLNVAMTLESDTFDSIVNGAYTLVQGKDYEVSGSNVILKNSYLKTLAVAPATLTFKFTSGTEIDYTVDVSDSTPLVNSITLTGESNINIPNQSEPDVSNKYTAKVLDQFIKEMPDESVTWTIAPEKTGVTIEQNGKEVTLKVSSNATAGKYKLTAVSVSNTAKYAEKEIELIPAGAPFWPDKTPIVFSEVDYEGLTLSWPAAQDANGTIVGYVVYGYNSDLVEVVYSSVYSVTYSVYGSTYSTNVSGLLPGKDYSFKVKALDNDGIWSPVGLSDSVTTKADQKPYWLESKTLTASDITTTGLKLTWSGAEDDRGITGYVVLKDGVETATVSGSVYSYQVTGLTQNTSYQFKVLAKDSYNKLSESGPELTVTTEKEIVPIGIQDSAISPAAATFYQHYNVSQDIAVDLTLNGNTLTAIKNGSTTLTEGTDYIKQGDNKVIIKRDYLLQLATGNSTLTFSFSAGKDAALVITVVNNYNPGHNSGGYVPSQPIEKKDNVTIDKSGDAVIKTEVKVDTKTGTAKVAVDKDTLKKAFDTAKEVDGKKTAIINVDKSEGAKGYTAEFPKDYIAGNSDKTVIKVNTELGSITIPGNMVPSSQVKDNESVGITISPVDPSTLSEEAKKQVGNRPTIKLELLIGGKASSWDSDNSKVQVTIPYKPTAEELADPEHIVVRYIDGKGKVVSIPSGKYDPATGMVTFETNHFSIYAVAYVKKTFEDLAEAEWSRKVVEVLASKGVISGTSETTFNPQANITRADYIILLVNALGLNADVDSNFKDVAKKDYYYNAVGIAKKLGIASGDGTNFNPKSMITRQDMMVLTEKALRIVNKIGDDKAKMDTFKDSSEISAYAKDSMAVLLKAGLIAGSDNMINPLSNATRAETAAFMYKVYNLK